MNTTESLRKDIANLVKQYAEIIPNIVQEIELTKKLYKKYHFDYILVWSETMLNHLIAIKLAKTQNIPIFLIQHGVYFDNPEMPHTTLPSLNTLHPKMYSYLPCLLIPP